MINITGSIDRLRQPEYTGDNRCIPCTVVNVAIAGALTAAVAVVSAPLAPVVLGPSLAAIYLRGYLVPGTPSLTKRYFPDWLLAKFDKAPEPTGTALENERDEEAAGDVESVDPERFFLEHDVVAPCAGTGDGDAAHGDAADDLCLADEIRTAWRDAIDGLRDGDRKRQVAAFLEVDPETVTVTRTNGHAIARVDGRLAAQWESDAALVADLAGSRTLGDRLPNWESLALEQRSQLASGLRAFAERCPACDGPVSLDADTVESCCRSYEVYAITCDDCSARVLEVQQ
ncbi:hypothetical protein [Natronococcus wangiae]|uniref:hypothetical protein n=1 Tax=Natronococcus wangiae TaxID=3068275 RepID=UPI00273F3D72|nr:hypothetical protein [Natronococcus sp. AD5]